MKRNHTICNVVEDVKDVGRGGYSSNDKERKEYTTMMYLANIADALQRIANVMEGKEEH